DDSQMNTWIIVLIVVVVFVVLGIGGYFVFRCLHKNNDTPTPTPPNPDNSPGTGVWYSNPTVGTGYSGGYNFETAQAYCIKQGANLATVQQVTEVGELKGFSTCAYGWTEDAQGNAASGMYNQKSSVGCGTAGFNYGNSNPS